ncbi:hypothetical protein MLS210_07390 [Helicobacter pylori]
MRVKNDIKIRLSYDFLEPTDEILECVLVPKELCRKFKAEVEATSFARRNGPIFKVKDNLFSDSSDGGVRSHIRSCIKWKLSRCRIPSTAHITPYGLDRKVGERSFRARTGKQL